MRNNLDSISEKAVNSALEEARALSEQGYELEVEGAGSSRTHFIKFQGWTFGQKVILKRAMETSGLNNAIDREYQTRNGHQWLTVRGYDTVVISDIRQNAHDNMPPAYELAMRLARPEQYRFRREAIQTFFGRCAITGCSDVQALEAAHVLPFAKNGHNDPSNALLLRADLHRLFDCNLLAINPKNGTATFAKRVTSYQDLSNCIVTLPKKAARLDAFNARWEIFQKLSQP